MTKLVVIPILCALLCSAERPSPQKALPEKKSEHFIRFDSELIRMRIDSGDSLELEGLYRFVCTESAPKIHGLIYPFPDDSCMGGVRVVELEFRRSREPWQDLNIEWAEPFGGILWRLPLEGALACEVRVLYRQALLASQARYIVTTTRGWDHPLRKARFEAYLGPELKNPVFSHPFAPCDSLGEKAYLFEAKDFWPEEDIVIRWRD